ncbi:MAG TPA: hypothetical protein VII01_07745, partial [Solirubrobacteraceae bacterium]
MSSSSAQHGRFARTGDVAPALLRALSNPATYGCAAVDVHETHASRVFVAGGRAYKVKKPVAFGFLDYSTLGRRHRACVEEVRINQELAPGLYVGVRAIVRTEMGYAFAPPNEEAAGAVEYAVEMRSFDESDTLSGLIRSEALTAEHLEAVARRLAEFHRTAPAV